LGDKASGAAAPSRVASLSHSRRLKLRRLTAGYLPFASSLPVSA